MVSKSIANLTLLCSKCGKLEMYDIHRFSIEKSYRRFVCGCGMKQASISASRRQYLLCVFCLVCEKNHYISIDKKKMWQEKTNIIYCPVSYMEIGILGSREKIENIIRKQHEAAVKLVEEISQANKINGAVDNLNEVFEIENPEVMLEILNRIHDVAEQDGLHCCCGSKDIRINLLADAVEIICENCNCRKIFPAKSETDKRRVEKISIIEIKQPVIANINNKTSHI